MFFEQVCPGRTYRTMVDPVCSGQGFLSDEGCRPCLQQKDCPAKHKLDMSESCTENSTRDTHRCLLCDDSCPAGQFLFNDCVDNPSFTKQCARCSERCSADNYISAACTRWSDVECKACNASCPRGMYLKTACSGSETADVARCDSCSTANCSAPGYFINVSACNDSVTSTVRLANLCRPCRTCPAGSWEASPCTRTNDRECRPCTLCQASSTGYGKFQVCSYDLEVLLCRVGWNGRCAC